MAQMMLIADDLTGALDAGVCLLPSRTKVLVDPKGAELEAADSSTETLCVNSDTRHMSSTTAATRVSELVAAAHGRFVVKKTDSALRGNIGAELAAAWRASGAKRLHFIPALPSMNRLTEGGVHYIDGDPVSQSVFGRDPFEPVRFSSVAEVIAEQTDAPVMAIAEGSPAPLSFEGIVVYDATSDGSIDARVEELARLGELGLTAGCAGLAASLARHFAAMPAEAASFEGGGLLVVCGSVNDVSRAQIAFARSCGAKVRHIAENEKTDDSWLASSAGREFITGVSDDWAKTPLTVVDGSGLEDLSGLVPSGADVRQVVSDHIGGLLSAICSLGIKGRVLVTGGDVLSSFLTQARIHSVVPLGQVRPGVVAFRAPLDAGDLVIASKSGGFGNRELLVELANINTK